MEFLSIDLEKLDFSTSGRENEIIDLSKLDFQPNGIDYAYYKKRYPLLDDEVIDKLVELYNAPVEEEPPTKTKAKDHKPVNGVEIKKGSFMLDFN